MRTLLSSILSLALLFLVPSAVGQPTFSYLDDSIMTNLVIVQGFGGTWSNLLRGGEIIISRDQQPTIDFIQSGSGIWLPTSGTLSYNNFNGFAVNRSFQVVSNLVVGGNITAGGNVSGATNIWNITNNWDATNVIYFTNTASISVDMNKPYSDLAFTGATFNFAGMDPSSFAQTNYQTAVILLRNGNTSATNTAIAVTGPNFATLHTQGVLWVTNETVCTFFYDPNVPFTNLICLPLW